MITLNNNDKGRPSGNSEGKRARPYPYIIISGEKRETVAYYVCEDLLPTIEAEQGGAEARGNY